MMKSISSLKQFLLLLGLLVAAAITSWYVARQVVETDSVSNIQTVAPVSVREREAVSTSEQTIAPVISANATIIQEESGDGWLLEAPAPSDVIAYKLLDEPVGVKAMINGGPSGFDCEWIGLGYANGSGGSESSNTSIGLPADATGVTMQCAVPKDIRASRGMNGLMVIQLAKPQTVQSLPLTAVAGSAGQGQVVVVNTDGTTESRTVGLGVSDTYNIQVTSGLGPGDQVLLFPVQSDFVTAVNP